MQSSLVVRAAALAAAVLGVTLVAACDYSGRYDGYDDYSDCDRPTRQCRTVCDYYCDSYGCYPSCVDECWDECRGGRHPSYPSNDPSTSSSSGSVSVDGGVSVPSPNDASVEPSGTGVLCTSCSANSECESGAVCILRGGAPREDAGAADSGAPVGRGFCGHACTTSKDCPDGFLCSQLGSTRQCLPTAGSCE